MGQVDEVRKTNTKCEKVKYPYLKFFTGDWLKDPRLSLCTPTARGVWIDLICAMHELDQSGELCGTTDDLARLARCSTVQLAHAISDLQNKRAADVSQRNGIWTIANRRMKKEAEQRRKRAIAGSLGGSKTQAKRQPTPDYDCDSDSDALERVREFSRGEGISEADADWFFWKGKGNGWTNRGQPILDWKATLRSWKRGGYLPSQRPKQGTKPWDQKKPDPNQERADREYNEARKKYG